jgi:hypothetical protein
MMTIIDSQYFPCLSYFSFLKSKEEIWIDTKEHFVKQTYRNRCYILASNQAMPLAVPVKNGSKKIPMDQIELDYNQKWLNQHWRAIISAYNKSPFFEYYEPYIHDILFSGHQHLLTLNQDILKFCTKVLNLSTSIHYTDTYLSEKDNNIEDMRSVIHPKKDYLCTHKYQPTPYNQLFGNKFTSNLSVLDLISCVGPESDNYL